jgi:hypothetical protein
MLRLAIVAALLALSVPAHAQPQTDALRKCVADNTSGKDRKDLARWIFLAMAAHPEIKQYASATASTAADEASRVMGALVTRLLTEACANETRAIFKSGGTEALHVAFQNLGQLAMQELATEKSVTDSMGLFERYIDAQRFRDLATGK